MTEYIDTAFKFLTDTPAGKDADSLNPTLRRYHQALWDKPLPSGRNFNLAPGTWPNAYMVYRSPDGVHDLTSDAITTYLSVVLPAS